MKRTIFILLLLIASCKEANKTQKIEKVDKTEPKFQLANSNFVLLTYQPKWHWTFENATPAALNNAELLQIEVLLKKAIIESNKTPNNEVLLKLDQYKRQYVSVLNSNGQKEVFVNFFCDDFGTDNWRTELLQVDDGGNCFFNLKVNLATQVYTLEINYNV